MNTKSKRIIYSLVPLIALLVVFVVQQVYYPDSTTQEFTIPYRANIITSNPDLVTEVSPQQLIEILNSNVIINAGTAHDQSYNITTQKGVSYKGVWNGNGGIINIKDGVDSSDILNLISGYSKLSGWNLTIACE